MTRLDLSVLSSDINLDLLHTPTHYTCLVSADVLHYLYVLNALRQLGHWRHWHNKTEPPLKQKRVLAPHHCPKMSYNTYTECVCLQNQRKRAPTVGQPHSPATTVWFLCFCMLCAIEGVGGVTHHFISTVQDQLWLEAVSDCRNQSIQRHFQFHYRIWGARYFAMANTIIKAGHSTCLLNVSINVCQVVGNHSEPLTCPSRTVHFRKQRRRQ